MQNNQMALFGHLFGHYVMLRILAEDTKHRDDATAYVETNVGERFTKIVLAVATKMFDDPARPMIKVQEKYDPQLGHFAAITLYGPEVDHVRPMCGEVQSVLMSKFPSYFDSFFQFLHTGKWENVPVWPLAFESEPS